jgi:hypothetical protein
VEFVDPTTVQETDDETNCVSVPNVEYARVVLDLVVVVVKTELLVKIVLVAMEAVGKASIASCVFV